MKIILALLLLTPAFAATTEDLLGTWRLVSFTRTIVAPPLDANADGRMAVAVLTWERMTPPIRSPKNHP